LFVNTQHVKTLYNGTLQSNARYYSVQMEFIRLYGYDKFKLGCDSKIN